MLAAFAFACDQCAAPHRSAGESYAQISCSEKLDEELVYRITKTLWENQEEAGLSSVEVAKWMHIENVLDIMEAAPLHPGAERYYKEIGIL